jgi:hypothetical protein
MPSKTLDKITEKEIEFCLKQFNLFPLHRFYTDIRAAGGKIALENENREAWTPSDGFGELKEHFSKPFVFYTARIQGTSQEYESYLAIFDKYYDYLTYFSTPLDMTRSALNCLADQKGK